MWLDKTFEMDKHKSHQFQLLQISQGYRKNSQMSRTNSSGKAGSCCDFQLTGTGLLQLFVYELEMPLKTYSMREICEVERIYRYTDSDSDHTI